MNRRTEPYLVQVGLDFGTAYLKAVCRDIVKDTAWPYVPSGDALEPACLVASQVAFAEGRLSRSGAQPLSSVKMALRAAALEQWDERVLAPYLQVVGDDRDHLRHFVECCATYSVAETLAGVRESVAARLTGFGQRQDDYVAVNMALPVADAELPRVNAAFSKVLSAAFTLSERVPPDSSIDILEVSAALDAIDIAGEVEACFLYPEVSANVQGFVRSRVSRPGVYLFCDVGAGTVDESVFIYHRNVGEDTLVYLAADVLPLGSTHLEQRAADLAGVTDAAAVAEFRRRKERGRSDPHLDLARNEMRSAVAQGTKRTMAKAKKKLHLAAQLATARVIFGGGGYAEHPYGGGAASVFHSDLFAQGRKPETLGMPVPVDLELSLGQRAWMPRLSVAYGLSFLRQDLVPFIYPVDVEPPDPPRITTSRPKAPSKDEV
jgi:hypothetical protein